jgi:hypothetical protein
MADLQKPQGEVEQEEVEQAVRGVAQGVAGSTEMRRDYVFEGRKLAQGKGYMVVLGKSYSSVLVERYRAVRGKDNRTVQGKDRRAGQDIDWYKRCKNLMDIFRLRKA